MPADTARGAVFSRRGAIRAVRRAAHDRRPRASIVIPVYDQFGHTLACLRALAEHRTQAEVEVIVVDDGSPDATGSALPQVAGMRYTRRAERRIHRRLQRRRRTGRGDCLVFLNNDTVPQPGWLDALVAHVRRASATRPGRAPAAVSGRTPAGSRRDGVRRRRRLELRAVRVRPTICRHAYVRDADYCQRRRDRRFPAHCSSGSAASTPATRRPTTKTPTWRSPCARGHARAVPAGGAWWCTSKGTTAGTDTGSGIKASQVRNREGSWRNGAKRSQRQPAAGTSPTQRCTCAGPQVLMIDALTPHADHDSGSLRLVNLMRLLREEGAPWCSCRPTAPMLAR